MSDRDALAREMYQTAYKHAKELNPETPIGLLVYHCGDIALRHIEAARAEERELADLDAARFRYLKTVTDTEPLSVDDWVTIASDEVTDVPAPAAPVVWTDDRIAAVRFLLNKADELAHTISGQDAERVHVILHNALGLLSTESEIRSATECAMRAALEAASREGK